MIKTTDINAWYEDIASKAKLDRPTVEKVLARHSIKPIIKPAVPQRLHLISLAFTGEKKGVLSGPIDFEWNRLEPGVHAIVSDDNFMGKTTIMKMMKLALNGSSGPQEDIDGWFHTLTLRFTVDGDVFETRVEDYAERRGSLVSIRNDKERVIARFEGEQAFKNAMETFFLDRLGLHTTKVVVERGSKEVIQEHGWPWLSSIMSIDPDPKDVFGNFPAGVGGMPSYLMRMFIGLPWVGTFTDIKAALKSLDMEDSKVDQATARNQVGSQARLQELQRQREEIEAKLNGPSVLEVFGAKEQEGLEQLSVLSEEIHALTVKRANLAESIAAAEEASTYAVRERHAFDEAQQAGTVFRLLRPEYCPSCDEVFTDEYRHEKERHHDCVVCGRHEKSQDDATGVREALVEREYQAKEQLKKLKAAQKKLFSTVKDKISNKATVEASLRDIQAMMRSVQSSAAAWRDALRLDAQIEEVRRLIQVEPEKDDLSRKVLGAAEKVTEQLFLADQKSMLNDVADLTTEFAKSFGMKTLERIEISGVNMRVFKSGTSTPFGRSTPGEKTRLKIAANLAMIQVAERRGIGRHTQDCFLSTPLEQTRQWIKMCRRSLKDCRSFPTHFPTFRFS